MLVKAPGDEGGGEGGEGGLQTLAMPSKASGKPSSRASPLIEEVGA